VKWTLEEIKAARLDDFRVFLLEVWTFLRLPAPTPMQYDIARTLQHGPERLVIEAFRGIGKSWITAVFVLWCLFCDPNYRVMVTSANQERADAFSTFTKRLITEMPLLQHMEPEGRTSNIAFDVAGSPADQAPSVRSVGITGQMTGGRANLIIGDDVEVPKNSLTHTMRERISELTKEFAAILKTKTTELEYCPWLQYRRSVYLGTPQVEDTLYNKLKTRGYYIRIWPSEVPESGQKYGDNLAPFVRDMVGNVPVGSPTDIRFNEEELIGRKIEYGIAGYALQFLLDTNPQNVERHPLKLSDLIIDSVDREMAWTRTVWGNDKQHFLEDLPAGGFDGDGYYGPVWRSDEMLPWQLTVMAIDPSGQGKDETGFCIMRLMYSHLYVVKVGGFKDGYGEDTLKALAMWAQLYKVNDVIIEPNFGGGMFHSLFEPVLHEMQNEDAPEHKARVIPAEDTPWSRGQKELRICDTLEPLVRAHRLTVDRSVVEDDFQQQLDEQKYSFVYQYTRMMREKDCLPHEDRLESVAMAAQYFVEYLKQNQRIAHEKHKDKLKENEIKKFMKAAKATFGFGRKGRKRWGARNLP
jgi:hypothetical protein